MWTIGREERFLYIACCSEGFMYEVELYSVLHFYESSSVAHD